MRNGQLSRLESPDAFPDGPDWQLPSRQGPPEVVVVDDVPPEPAPGPASLGIIARGEVADGELALVGPPEGSVSLRTFWPEGMPVSVAVPEAAPEPMGARLAEERGLGLDDAHAAEFIGEEVPTSRARCQWGA